MPLMPLRAELRAAGVDTYGVDEERHSARCHYMRGAITRDIMSMLMLMMPR